MYKKKYVQYLPREDSLLGGTIIFTLSAPVLLGQEIAGTMWSNYWAGSSNVTQMLQFFGKDH